MFYNFLPFAHAGVLYWIVPEGVPYWIVPEAVIALQLSAVCMQVFHIGLEFYSPMPKAILIERLFAGSDGYQAWQYYAENCTSYFGVENNGPLTAEDTVNCIQLGA